MKSLILLISISLIAADQSLLGTSHCQQGSYLSPDNQCLGCPWYCRSCTQAHSCSLCFTGSSFHSPSNSCKCPGGQYMSSYYERC